MARLVPLYARKTVSGGVPGGGGGGGSTTFDPHFGFYVAPAYNNSNDPPTIVNSTAFFQVVNGSPTDYNVRGTQLRYAWIDLETSKDAYSGVDQIITDLGKHTRPGVRCFIAIIHRSSGGTATNAPKNAVPAYMLTSEYGNGQRAYNQSGGKTWPSGYLTCFWNANVQTRFKLLIQAIADRINTAGLMDKVEGIGLLESPVGTNLSGQTPLPSTGAATGQPSEQNYYLGWVEVLKGMRTSFPNKIAYAFMNFEADTMHYCIDEMPANKIALGTPDTFIEEVELIRTGKPEFPAASNWQGVYQYYIQNLNTIPLIGSIQPQNFQGNRGPFPSQADGIPTRMPNGMEELVNFNRTTIRPNYLIVTYTNADYTHPGYAGITYTHPANGYSFWDNWFKPYMMLANQQANAHVNLNNFMPSVLTT